MADELVCLSGQVVPTPSGMAIPEGQAHATLKPIGKGIKQFPIGFFSNDCTVPTGEKPSFEQMQRLVNVIEESFSADYCPAQDDWRYVSLFRYRNKDPLPDRLFVEEVNRSVRISWSKCHFIQYYDEVYAFPQTLLYLIIAENYQPPLDFIIALMHGKPLKRDDFDITLIAFVEDVNQSDLILFGEQSHETSETPEALTDNFRSQTLSILDPTLPARYAGDDVVKKNISIHAPINFGDSPEDAEYSANDYYLPRPVDPSTLRQLIGRQNIHHVAMAHMAHGLRSLKRLAEEDELCHDLLVQVFTKPEKFDEFKRLVEQKETPITDNEANLRRLAPKYFPFDEEGAR